MGVLKHGSSLTAQAFRTVQITAIKTFRIRSICMGSPCRAQYLSRRSTVEKNTESWKRMTSHACTSQPRTDSRSALRKRSLSTETSGTKRCDSRWQDRRTLSTNSSRTTSISSSGFPLHRPRRPSYNLVAFDTARLPGDAARGDAAQLWLAPALSASLAGGRSAGPPPLPEAGSAAAHATAVAVQCESSGGPARMAPSATHSGRAAGTAASEASAGASHAGEGPRRGALSAVAAWAAAKLPGATACCWARWHKGCRRCCCWRCGCRQLRHGEDGRRPHPRPRRHPGDEDPCDRGGPVVRHR
mmetsp:Transcript_10499/g.28569  ORF Transcript_10499/g.28569 Transcript_10499/m.28569 type:complete len:301 (+) Transcript_10499:337-1239(+)